MAFAVIPFGPAARISIFGDTTRRCSSPTCRSAVLYVLAVAVVGVYGIVLAGWSSGSTYPLLGGLRSSAQVISYEIAMGLALVAVFLYAGSMSTSAIVDAQAGDAACWYAILAAAVVSFVIYCVSMVGETNRAPFDLPEAEGELVGGFHTEYSSLKFALFFLAEYINMVTVSALATTLFLGGWRAPWPSALWEGAQHRLVADAVVRRSRSAVPVRLHLAARHAAPAALRPVHEARLEGAHPGRAGLADRGRRGAGAAQRATTSSLAQRAASSPAARSLVVGLLAACESDQRPERRRRRGGRGAAESLDPMAGGTRSRRCPGRRLAAEPGRRVDGGADRRAVTVATMAATADSEEVRGG